MLSLTDKYINPFTDFGFKKLFGEESSKEALIDFLNTLLQGEESEIVSLTFINNEQLGESIVDRRAIFDLYCENQEGEKFIVELQKSKQNFFKERSLYYSTFPIREQALKGDWNYNLKAVYTIGILDFVFDEDKNSPDKYFYKVKLKDIDTNEIFYDKLTFIYLEMPKFSKTIDELETHFDRCLYVLRNLEKLDQYPNKLQEKIFKEFFKKAEIAQLEPEAKQSYENSLKYYRDLNNVIDTAFDDGLEQGELNTQIKTVLALHQSGSSIEFIQEITGLEIKKIMS
ncbi:Rpn family recombination-promoting nuclease/putative transposase [Marinicellulosiphila megalodicopiae]|uniref:Rpn family recombination-promoting nuclease/putative transposase n=1 Tax=Marinicellulosiphila megalodicopiae TaxID=2724896 RepID=UPI003BAFF1DD